MYVRRVFSFCFPLALWLLIDKVSGIWGATLAMAFYLDLVNGDPL
jgi:hypothetical protein